ncbi:MAG: hypothetical protein VX211_04520 [Pseudomonadota bacterium]|nr:hypothetical protein [Pseudomonadota bacterium]
MSKSKAVKFSEFTDQLAAGLGKVPKRFVRDVVVGMLRSRSVRIWDIATALDGPVRIHATHKRLSRNLARQELADTIPRNLLRMIARRVKQETPLVTHVYPLQKKYAKKMEFLVDDEASSETEYPAYQVCEVAAYDPTNGELMPVAAHLWSRHAPEYVSDSDEILSALKRVHEATAGRGVFFLDPDVSALILETKLFIDSMSCDGLRLVTVVSGRIELLHEEHLKFVDEIRHLVERPFGVTTYKWIQDVSNEAVETAVVCSFGSNEVRLAETPDKPMSLIVVDWDIPGARRDGGEPLVYLSSEPAMKERDQLAGVVVTEFQVPDVVRAIRSQKEAFDLSQVRVLTYDRLRVLLGLLHAAIYFEVAVLKRRSTAREWTRSLNELSPRIGDHPRSFMVPDEMRKVDAGSLVQAS